MKIQISLSGQLDRDKRDKYRRWKSYVNMTVTQLEKFRKSDEGKAAGLTKEQAKAAGIKSGQESAKWILRMKATKPEDWTPNMWAWASRQISFIVRMSASKGPLFDAKGQKTRKHTSLLIWGHNPMKGKSS